MMEELHEAQARMEEALEEATAAEQEKMRVQNECWEKLQAERRYFWEQIQKGNKTAVSKLESERRGFEAIISELKAKQGRDIARVRKHIADRDSELDRQAEKHRPSSSKLMPTWSVKKRRLRSRNSSVGKQTKRPLLSNTRCRRISIICMSGWMI